MTAGICCLGHRHEPERPRRALDGALVCRGCAADLQRVLDGEDRRNNGVRDRVSSIGELWLELAEILPAGSQGTGVAVSGSREPALPFQPLVSTHMATIRDQLCAWAVQHCDQRSERGPRNADPTTVGPWLAARLEWAMRQDWIVDYADELRRMRGKALALLYPERRSIIPLAWCLGRDATSECECVCHTGGYRRPCNVPGGCGAEHTKPCDGVLSAVLYGKDTEIEGTIVCDVCAAAWPPYRWGELDRKIRVRAKNEGAA